MRDLPYFLLCLLKNTYLLDVSYYYLCVGQHRAKGAFPLSCLEVHPLRAGEFPQQPKWIEMKGN